MESIGMELIRSTDWVEVLRLLGIPNAGRILPAHYCCPICSAPRLHIYEDTTTHHAWHYCKDCQSSGDLITLAAATWQVKFETAARQLADHGAISAPNTEAAITAYTEGRLKMQQDFLKMWEVAQRRLEHNGGAPEVKRLRYHAGFPLEYQSDFSDRRAHRYMGCSITKPLEASFGPISVR